MKKTELSVFQSCGVYGIQIGDKWINDVTDYKIIGSADGSVELIMQIKTRPDSIRLKMHADMAEFTVSTTDLETVGTVRRYG